MIDDIGTSQNVELAISGQITNVDSVGAGRVLHFKVPIIAAAMDFDVAQDGLGRARGVVAADVQQAENWFGAVPVLAEGRFARWTA